jgi:peptidoglycan/xylan/chitin deacetylase (PgdA/CDA1 family)
MPYVPPRRPGDAADARRATAALVLVFAGAILAGAGLGALIGGCQSAWLPQAQAGGLPGLSGVASGHAVTNAAPAVSTGPSSQSPSQTPTTAASAARPSLFPFSELPRSYFTEPEVSIEKMVQQHREELAKGIRHREIMQGNPFRRQVALTFDDGPHRASTPKLLAILHHYGVKATFFVVGECAVAVPDLIRDEVADGHIVGNHTYHHLLLTHLSPERSVREIAGCGEAIARITGTLPHLFRPPGGHYNHRVARELEDLGYTLVLWTDNGGDWIRPGTRAIERKVLDRVGSGGIILLHDGPGETLQALPVIIETLEREHYRFVTVDEMMKSR